MKLKHAVVFATALSLAPFTAFAGKKAAPAAPKSAIPTLDQVLGASGINLSGTVDVSYDVSANDGTGAGGGLKLRAFDVHPNSFVFHQLNFTVSKQWSNGLSLVVNPVFGEDANVINGGTTRGTAASALANSEFSLLQAYLSYTMGDLTIMGGRYVTLAGSEVINPAGNINASRSLLFTGFQPLTHLGVRGTYALCKNLTVTIGGANSGAPSSGPAAGSGTNSVLDNNSGISTEAQIAYTGGLFSTAVTYIHGAEANSPTLGADNRDVDLYDFVASVTPIDALTLGINADYRVSDVGGFNAVGDETYDSGVAAYVNFKLTPKARIALRGEYVVIDTNAANTAAADGSAFLNEVTATFGYSPLSNLELLAEFRNDDSTADAAAVTFTRIGPAGGLPGGGSSYQQTGTLKAIYKF